MQILHWQTLLEQTVAFDDPECRRRLEAWKTAIGLQSVDDLHVSMRLIEAARRHIEGKGSIKDLCKRICTVFEADPDQLHREDSTIEADLVSARMVEVLLDPSFRFSAVELANIHLRLFSDLYEDAGSLRTCQLYKTEPFLNGDSVIYAPHEQIIEILRYDFHTERNFYYDDATFLDVVIHYAKFISNLWQIHPFRQGNTRTIGIFMLKHVRSFGLELRSNVFADDSVAFRNALLSANYSNPKKGIKPNYNALVLFMSHLLVGTRLDVFRTHSFRECPGANIQTGLCPEVTEEVSRALSCTFQEAIFLNYLYQYPTITQKELSQKMSKPYRLVQQAMTSLQKKGYIRRKNGNRYGSWEILFDKVSDES